MAYVNEEIDFTKSRMEMSRHALVLPVFEMFRTKYYMPRNMIAGGLKQHFDAQQMLPISQNRIENYSIPFEYGVSVISTDQSDYGCGCLAFAESHLLRSRHIFPRLTSVMQSNANGTHTAQKHIFVHRRYSTNF